MMHLHCSVQLMYLYMVTSTLHNNIFIHLLFRGVLAVYGIIIGYMLSRKLDYADDKVYAISQIDGYKHLCAGLSVGLACVVSGYGMGNYLSQLNKSEYYFVRKGKADATENASKKMDFVTFVLCLIYLEAIGLYGLIVALFLVG